MNTTEQKPAASTWRFPKDFWIANFMELLERAAYYGFFIVLTLYLTDIVGFTDIQTGFIAGIFTIAYSKTFTASLAEKRGSKYIFFTYPYH